MQVVTKMALDKLKKQPAIFVDSIYEAFWLDFAVKVVSSVIVDLDDTSSEHQELSEFIDMLPESLLERSDVNFNWEDESGNWPLMKEEIKDE